MEFNNKQPNIDVGFGYPVARVEREPYTGEYDVSPVFSDIVLPTNGKRMTNDVTAHAPVVYANSASATNAKGVSFSDALPCPLLGLQQSGKCEQSNTATWDTPKPIYCNNGALVYDNEIVHGSGGQVVSVNGDAKAYVSVPDLLSVSNFADTFDIVTGTGTKRCKAIALTGLENWQPESYQKGKYYTTQIEIPDMATSTTVKLLCTHTKETEVSYTTDTTIGIRGSNGILYARLYKSMWTNVADWKSYLAQQLYLGNPVIVVYVLGAAETISETPVYLPLNNGSNSIQMTTLGVNSINLVATYLTMRAGGAG